MGGARAVTGWDVLDDLIGSPPRAVLFYGEAGIGKTNMLLWIARRVCRSDRPCIYISTEGSLYQGVVARRPEDFRGVLFGETRDLPGLLEVVVRGVYPGDTLAVFIDSINAPFRASTGSEDSIALFGLVLALLRRKIDEAGGYLFASAQVRGLTELEPREEGEEVVASGMSILEYWFDVIVYLGVEEGLRYARIVKPGGVDAIAYFMVVDGGVEWLESLDE